MRSVSSTRSCDSRQIVECSERIWHLIYVTSEAKSQRRGEKAKKTDSCIPYRTLNTCTCDFLNLFCNKHPKKLDELQEYACILTIGKSCEIRHFLFVYSRYHLYICT